MTTTDWLIPLITGAIGASGAVVGAFVGSAGALRIWRREARERREQERRAAFVDFYAAANSFALMYDTWSKIKPKGWLADARLGIRTLGYQKMIGVPPLSWTSAD